MPVCIECFSSPTHNVTLCYNLATGGVPFDRRLARALLARRARRYNAPAAERRHTLGVLGVAQAATG